MSKLVPEPIDIDAQLDRLGKKQQALMDERDRYKKALKKYAHCRHGCLDCNCANDARAALWQPEEQPDGE